MTGKKILVTGGAGFMGSHLVDALATAHDVTVVDNLTSGSRENIQHHLKNGAIHFVQEDIRNADKMKELIQNCDVIFHLAVQGLRLSLYDPQLVHEVNASGTLNLCQAALEAGVEKFVNISSSEVYGTALTAPMNEEHPLIPTTPYGASKLAAEAYARSYYLSFDLPVVIVRPFNTYGPREHMEGVYGEVIPRFTLRVMNDLPPVVFGDGLQTRDFTEVSDIVRGIILAAECDDLIGKTVNIAAGKEVSINRVAQIIIDLLGRSGQLEPQHIDPRPGDVRRHFADISQARDILGFQAEIDITEGIRHYLDWVKSQDLDLQHIQHQEKLINWRP
jgi:UDP-glucose 4-epimerase